MRINSIQFNNIYNFKKQSFEKTEMIYKTANADSLQCLANQNIAFCGKKPVYALDKDGNLLYFESAQRAALELELNESSVAKVLKEKNHLADKYALAYASEMEIVDETGKKIVNPQAVQKLEESFDKAKNVPVYLVDYDGNIKRFDSETKAAKFLGITLKAINKTVKNHSYVADGCLVIPASEIELRDKNGKVVLDANLKPVLNYEKIHSELAKFTNIHSTPICTISYLGEITRYNNRQQVLDSGRYGDTTISSCLSTGKPSVDVIFVHENEILKRNEFGKTSIDSDCNYVYDLDEINKRLQVFANSKSRPIRAKNVRTKEISYFANSSQAASALGISKQMISNCLKGEYPFRGYSFQYLYPMYLNEYQVSYYHSK